MASDAGSVFSDLGARFATCSYTTALNAGFDTMTTQLMLPNGDRSNPRLPVALAGEIFRTWRGMIARVYLAGTLAWAGRAAGISVNATGAVTVDWQGFAYDLERERPALDASYADEFATVSASSLLRAAIGQSTSLIAHSYRHVQETSVNVGAISTSMQDSTLSLILNQLKGASSAGVEFAFLVWDPADGPYLVPIGVGPTRYRLRLADSPGAAVRWSLDEYVSDSLAIFTDGDGNSDATEWKTAPDGPGLNGGLRAYRSISVDAVNAEGALAARDSFLELHKDPLGITGNLTAQDYVLNDEGGQELAGLVRAGEIAHVPDALPFDSLLGRTGRTWAIASTSYDVFSGSLSLTLDQRSIQSREVEKMTDIRHSQRLIESGLAHNVTRDTLDQPAIPIPVPNDTDTRLTTVPIPFTCVRRMKVGVRIVVEVNDLATSTLDSPWYVGFTVDGEDWIYTDQSMASLDLIRNGLNGGNDTVQGHPKPRSVTPGAHQLHVWVRKSNGSYEVPNFRVFIDT